MGIFTSKVICSVCSNECGLNRFSISNKEWCCPSCFSAAGFTATTSIRTMHPEMIRVTIQKRAQDKENLQSFTITKEVAGWLKIDENKRKWYIPDGFAGKTKKPRIHSFSDIVGYELLEDGESIIKGGLGQVIAGGLLFGGVGAIVGGVTGKRKTKALCTSLKVKITLNDMTMPIEYINLISTETKKSGFLYKTYVTQAQEILSLLEVIYESNMTAINATPEQSISPADEIMKFKQLLDAGAITVEEFETQKIYLLDL